LTGWNDFEHNPQLRRIPADRARPNPLRLRPTGRDADPPKRGAGPGASAATGPRL